MTFSIIVYFFAVFRIGQYLDRTQSGRERGQGRERSVSWDSNLGRPKHNGAIYRRTVHEATGADNTFYFYFDKMINKKCASSVFFLLLLKVL